MWEAKRRIFWMNSGVKEIIENSFYIGTYVCSKREIYERIRTCAYADIVEKGYLIITNRDGGNII